MCGIKFDKIARRRLKAGVDLLADTVRVRFGPLGRRVVIDDNQAGATGSLATTRDGSAIAHAVEVPDPVVNLGVRLAREVAERTRSVAGGGSSTTVVLAQAIIDHGLKAVAAGAEPMAVKRGIDLASRAVATHLAATAWSVDERPEIAAVAAIAAAEPRIGELLADVFHRVGKDGSISVEETPALGVEVEYLEGTRFDEGYISPYMITDHSRGVAVLDDPYVLLYADKILDATELLPLLDKVVAAGKSILIMADNVQREALTTLELNNRQGKLISVAVKAPALGRSRARLEDMAALTAGQVITPEAGMRLDQLELEVLGRARKVVVGKQSTTLIGVATPQEVASRVRQIRYELAETSDSWARGILLNRLATLAGGVAVIRVGGPTTLEMKERAQRIEAAVTAVRAALEEGVVAGGGAALVHAAAALRGDLDLTGDERTGVEAVRHALSSPLQWIANNAGRDGRIVAGAVAELNDAEGYNAHLDTYGDLVAAGVVDPAKVVRAALLNAASVAGMVLTAEAVLVDASVVDEERELGVTMTAGTDGN